VQQEIFDLIEGIYFNEFSGEVSSSETDESSSSKDFTEEKLDRQVVVNVAEHELRV
jgi:hypothetical protein